MRFGRRCVFVVAFGLLGIFASGCGGSACGDTTAQSSSITGAMTYGGVAATYTQTNVSAFSDSIVASWTTGPDAIADGDMLRLAFKNAPLAQGSFALEAQNPQLCIGSACESAATTGNMVGTMVVTKFVVDPCAPPSNIGCATQLDADVKGKTTDGSNIVLDVHLHLEGKQVAAEGCIGNRLGK